MSDAMPLFPSRRKNLDRIVEQLLSPNVQSPSSSSVVDAGDFLELRNIVCYDHTGKEVESYDTLLVKKDIERKPDKTPYWMTLYQAISHFERQNNGLFLPSLRLTTAIVVALYAEKDRNPEIQRMLDQYKDRGDGRGWHVTNTVGNWSSNQVLDYPIDSDFPDNGGTNNVNNGARTKRSVIPITANFISENLDKTLKDKKHKEYLQDVTGLKHPEILLGIATYFRKTPKTWRPNNNANYTSGAWLGCSSDDFNVNVDNDLNYSSAVRGVRSR